MSECAKTKRASGEDALVLGGAWEQPGALATLGEGRGSYHGVAQDSATRRPSELRAMSWPMRRAGRSGSRFGTHGARRSPRETRLDPRRQRRPGPYHSSFVPRHISRLFSVSHQTLAFAPRCLPCTKLGARLCLCFPPSLHSYVCVPVTSGDSPLRVTPSQVQPALRRAQLVSPPPLPHQG